MAEIKKPKPKKKKKITQSASKKVIADRRAIVERLMSRGLTLQDIQSSLANDMMNPKATKAKNGTAWSLTTIGLDSLAIKKAWLDSLGVPLDEQKSEAMAEITEVIRLAFAANDFKSALLGIKAKRELIGMDAPKKTDLTSDGEKIGVIGLGVDTDKV